MPLGQAFAGTRLTAAMLRAAAPLSAYKSSSQSVTSSTTLVTDNALSVPLLANAVYDFELTIGYNGANGAGNIKLAWVLPGSATIGYTLYGNTTSGAATDAPWITSNAAQALGTLGATVPVGAVLSGTVATVGTAGTLQLEWAQNSSNGTATTVLAGSVLVAWQVQCSAPAVFIPRGRLTGAALRGVAPLVAYKSVAESVTSSIILQSDDALLLQLKANAVYYFRCKLGYLAASGTGDLKLGWLLPSGAVMGYALYGNSGGSATNGFWETQASVPAVGGNGATAVSVVMRGTVDTAATPGVMQLQWCQHTLSATATSVLQNSSLLAWRVQ